MTSKQITFITMDEDIGRRLDIFLAENLGVSRMKAQSLIKREKVKILNITINKPAYLIPENDVKIDVETLEHQEDKSINPEKIPLDIIFENDDVIVISKQPGIVVHPDHAHKSGTLVNAILGHLSNKSQLSNIGGVTRPGVVHRLDQDTSGVIIFAKNDESHLYLSQQFALRQVEKQYLAIVHGTMKHNSGTIDSPIVRAHHDRQRMAIATGDKKGRHAITHFKVLRQFEDATYLEVKIETGRTHQIRVHFAAINHPAVGDNKYSKGRHNKMLEQRIKTKIPRIFLHAEKLSITLPGEKHKRTFVAPLPIDLFEFMRKL